MLLEDMLLAVAVGAALLMTGLPIYRLLKAAPWRPRNPLAEAQERLRLAKLEAEAEKVNREAEKIYERLYDETLGDDRAARKARVVKDEEAVHAGDEPIEKGKRHGQD